MISQEGTVWLLQLRVCVLMRTGGFPGPIMVHSPFLRLTERVSGSHPHRIVSVSYGRVAPFHGGNAGSNPAGDAKLFQVLTSISSPSQISLVALG